jgi:hypothetical protein
MKRAFIVLLLTAPFLTLLWVVPAGARQGGFGQGEKERIGAGQESRGQTASVPALPPNVALAPLRRDFKGAFPIPQGEKLEYEVKFSKFPIYASVGVVTFENLGAVAPGPQESPGAANAGKREPLLPGANVEFAPSPEEQILHLRANAVSKGMLIAIVGVDVRDRFETLVGLRDFSERMTLKETKEGKKHTIQTAVYDSAQQQVKYTTNDLNNPQAPPRVKPLPRQDGMLSLLSAFYFVRLQKLKEGQTLVFPVSSDEANYQFEIHIGKRENLKTDCGKVKALRIEPKLFGPGRLISRQGEMTMWLSDDQSHTPLQMVAKTASGTVTAKLLNYKDKCQLLDPLIEESRGKEKPKAKKPQKGE